MFQPYIDVTLTTYSIYFSTAAAHRKEVIYTFTSIH